MKVLGISAFYHDSAASLLIDGKIITAVEEERFSRIKHDNAFPYHAIHFCLESQNLTISDLDAIAYYEKPLLKFERILEMCILSYPFSLLLFIQTVKDWLSTKIKVEYLIKKLGFSGKIFFYSHHFSHAAAAYFPSPFKNAAIVTIDGVGEWQTTALWKAENSQISFIKSLHFPHSLGLLYSTITAFLGYKVNEDEYIVMGLAAYGKPRFENKLKQTIEVKSDGSFQLKMKYFAFDRGKRMWSNELKDLLGNPRLPNEKITKRHKDIAASLQKLTEYIYFSLLNHAYQVTQKTNLCISGGVALNAVANGKLRKHTPFNQTFIFGPAGDSGSAIGAAYAASISHTLKRQVYSHVSFGSSYTNHEIRQFLERAQIPFTYFTNEADLLSVVVSLLMKKKIIGWFQGKMEFGPRSLGNRSLLAATYPLSMKQQMNKIKIREQFRPFAGSILQEHVQDYFYVPDKNYSSPFMTECFQVKEAKEHLLSAIVHVDKTCRIQTVNKTQGRYYRLLKLFYEKANLPILMNTSFNLKGEPIIENPKQAVTDFYKTALPALVLENFLILKHPIHTE